MAVLFLSENGREISKSVGEYALPVYVAGVLLDLSLLLQADPCAWIFWAGCRCCFYCLLQCCVLPQPICLVGTVIYGMFRKPVVMERPLWVFYTVLHLQGMLCIPGYIRPRSSLLEQRKLEIFLGRI